MQILDGATVKRLRIEKGWSIRQLARKAQISNPYLGQYESGKRLNLGVQKLMQIAEALGVRDDVVREGKASYSANPEMALDEITDHIKALIPVYEQVSAGDGSIEPIDYVACTTQRPRPESMRAYRVKGLCLEPEIKDGDTLIVDTSLSPQPGNLVVVIIDGVPSVKRYRSYPDGKKWLENNDGRYTPESVHLHGVVTDINHKLV